MEKDADYRRGYLCGMIRGDGLLGSYHYERPEAGGKDQHHFRLALCDFDALERSREYLRQCRVETFEFEFCRGQRQQATNARYPHVCTLKC